MFTVKEVLSIVDSCFHSYASDYRNDAKEYAKDIMARMMRTKTCDKPAVINWVAFDWMKIETRPTEYGKYLIARKDGKIHWETWNGNGWAYNHNEVRFWAVINKPPCL